MRLIDVDVYCATICKCNSRECDRAKCPIHNAPTAYDIDKVVAELEKEKSIHTENYNISLYKDYPEIKQRYKQVCGVIDKAIEIVKQGGVSDDVCEEVCCEWKHFSGDKSPYRPSCKEYMKSKFEAFKIGDYCTFCGKKIKVVE